ncbi:Rac GTPase-activating protein 1 [Eumeta japonica]|uniref:Rac GTPase-activating protein 1 n=1 Tax=Eumeta variegata TaxID=151549 RepID=A0A4C2A3B4_EUMVA|nr:Rac GTPase-activating protein 1 [Eumeta japonica]
MDTRKNEQEAVRLQSEWMKHCAPLPNGKANLLMYGNYLTQKRAQPCVKENKLLEMARDLLFNDNRTKLNDETLQKLAFLNGTAQEQHGKLNGVPELNSTGTLLSEMSYSRSEDDLDISLASARRSWVQRGAWATKDQPATKKRRSSGSSFTKLGTVEVQGGSLVAKATTTLTLEKAPIGHELKPHRISLLLSPSDILAPPKRPDSAMVTLLESQVSWAAVTIYPGGVRSYGERIGQSPRAIPQRTPSLYNGSPRARLRQHNFVAKNFYKRETCAPCGKTIKFAKVGVRCEICRAHAHPECRGLLPCRRYNSRLGSTHAPMVPALLVHCVNEVERRGLTERGIYRVGSERFLRGCGSPQLHTEDIHVICGCIKDFLRSLREPLVSSALWSDFMHVATISDSSEATAALVHCVSQLPQPNRDTLAFLVLHLQKVAESPECEMGIDNLAKMFGPHDSGIWSD